MQGERPGAGTGPFVEAGVGGEGKDGFEQRGGDEEGIALLAVAEGADGLGGVGGGDGKPGVADGAEGVKPNAGGIDGQEERGRGGGGKGAEAGLNAGETSGGPGLIVDEPERRVMEGGKAGQSVADAVMVLARDEDEGTKASLVEQKELASGEGQAVGGREESFWRAHSGRGPGGKQDGGDGRDGGDGHGGQGARGLGVVAGGTSRVR